MRIINSVVRDKTRFHINCIIIFMYFAELEGFQNLRFAELRVTSKGQLYNHYPIYTPT